MRQRTRTCDPPSRRAEPGQRPRWTLVGTLVDAGGGRRRRSPPVQTTATSA